ncbi:hypothetical protein SEA_CELAENA_38 [Microbacterium phage Celaena]|uniref:hypothetical protein n=1 Tax=Microbacterium phage Celaena TaxID=2591214 RepID=UPI001163F03C|nr:hypothetical protein QDW17_gp38 [Microbacterium phage Celaena]YP_010752365.1 hypothetical protein QDW18_gp39 [Microbacterium phage Katzastrophic]QDH92417.1 hypothetical protein SEA_CELAENA_38 [Microbacterium phage Celaena]UKH48476.1 hypothetical protein SEA_KATZASTROPHIC_39 [Microbacterium phage Katzastrophic]WNO28753.1 hypothetical protein SEA_FLAMETHROWER_38 [Microbacterium phage FlameThrower]
MPDAAPNPLDVIEAAASFADVAATFRDALVAQDFHSAPAEQTALHMASAIFTSNLAAPPKKR